MRTPYSTSFSSFLAKRQQTLFVMYNQEHDEEEALRLAREHAWSDLEALRKGEASPDVLGEYTEHQFRSLHEPRLIPEDSMRFPSTPLGDSLDSTWGQSGWKTPIEFVQGAFGSRVFDDRARRPLFSFGMPPAMGTPMASDWTSGARGIDATLNLLWNFYDKMTLFLGPLQKLVERKTGWDVYPDWTENPQDRLVRAMGGVGAAAGIILPAIATKGATLKVRGLKEAPTAAGKVLTQVEKWAIGRKVFVKGGEIPKKIIAKQMEKAGFPTLKVLESQAAVKAVKEFSPEQLVALGGPERAREIAASIVAKSSSLRPAASVRNVEAISKEAFSTIKKDLVGYLGDENMAASIAGTLKDTIKPFLTQKAYHTLSDVGRNWVERAALGWAQSSLVIGTSMAVHGAASTVAHGIASGVPWEDQFEMVARSAGGAYATGAIFGIVGMIPNAGTVDRVPGELLGRALGFTTQETAAYTKGLVRLRLAESAAGKIKGVQGLEGLTATEMVKGHVGSRINVPYEAFGKSGWWYPDVEKVPLPRLESMGKMIKHMLSSSGSTNRKISYLQDKYKVIMQGRWDRDQLPGLKGELAEFQREARHMILKIGIHDSVKDFGQAMPRMFVGAVALNARELISDWDVIKEYPEDFINSFLMSMYFLRNPNVPYKRKHTTSRDLYGDIDPDLAKQLAHASGMVFPEFLGDPKMAGLLMGFSQPPLALADHSREKIVQRLEKMVLDAPDTAPQSGNRVARIHRKDTPETLAGIKGAPTLERAYRRLVNTYIKTPDDAEKVKTAEEEWKRASSSPTAKFHKLDIPVGEVRKQAEVEKRTLKEHGLRSSPTHALEERYFDGQAHVGKFLTTDRLFQVEQIAMLVNEAHGIGSKKVIDTDKLTLSQKYNIYQRLSKIYGTPDGRLDIGKIENEFAKTIHDKEVPLVFDMIQQYSEDAWRGGLKKLMPNGLARIDVSKGIKLTGPDDAVAIDLHNMFIDKMHMIGGPHLGMIQAAYDKKDPAVLEKMGPRAGDPKAEVFVVTDQAQLDVLRQALIGTAKVKGAAFLAQGRFADIVGRPNAGMALTDPQTWDSIHEITKRGGFYAADQFFDNSSWWVPLTDPTSSSGIGPSVGGKRRQGVNKTEFYGMMTAFQGVFTKEGKQYSMLLPPYEQLDQGVKGNLPGVEKGDDPVYTKKSMYDLTRIFMERLHHYDKDIISSGSVKEKFTPQEARALHDFIVVNTSAGFVLGLNSAEAYKMHRLTQRFRQATPQQLDVLNRATQLGVYDMETGVVKLPQQVSIRFQDGKPVINKVNISVVDPEVSQAFIDQIHYLHKVGIVKDIITSETAHMTEAGWHNLTFPIRAASAYSVPEIGKFYQDMAQRLDLSKVAEKSASELLQKQMTEMLRTGVRPWQLLEAMEKHGVISALRPDGTFDVVEARNILSEAFKKEIGGAKLSLALKDQQKISEEAQAEVRAILGDLSGDLAPEKTDIRLKLQTFVDRIGLRDHDDIIADATTKLRFGKIKTPEELGQYFNERVVQTYGNLVPGNAGYERAEGFVQNVGNMTMRNWQSVYNQLQSSRVVPVIKVGGGHEPTYDAEGRMTGVASDQFIMGNAVVHGPTLIDRLETGYGFHYVKMDGKILEGYKVPSKAGGYVSVNDELIFRNAEKTKKLFRDVLTLTHEGVVNQNMGTTVTRDVIVPLAMGGSEHAYAVRVPTYSHDPKSDYAKFRGTLKTRIDALAEIEARMVKDAAAGVNWDRGDLSLRSMMGHLKAMYTSMPDTTDMTYLEGALFPKVTGLGPTQISKGIHVMMLSELYGDSRGGVSFWNELYAVQREMAGLPEGTVTERGQKLARMIGKYSKQLSTTTPTTMDESTWGRAVEEANRRAVGGPKLDPTHARIILVEDNSFWDGQVGSSMRYTRAMSAAYGSNRDQPIWKAYWDSGDVRTLDAPNVGHKLYVKPSIQAIEGLEPQFGHYGVDHVMPMSVAKVYFPELLAGRDPISISEFMKMQRSGDAHILRVPHTALKVTYVKNANQEAAVSTISQGMELGFEQGGVQAFRDWFMPRNWQSDPQLRAFDSVLQLLNKAQYGSDKDWIVANTFIRSLYSSDLLEPEYDSFHKSYLFSSLASNPMAPAVRQRTLNMVMSKLVREGVLKKRNPNIRKATGTVPFRQLPETTSEDPFYLPSSKDTGIGTFIGPDSSRIVNFGPGSQTGWLDPATNTWKLGDPFERGWWVEMVKGTDPSNYSTDVKRILRGLGRPVTDAEGVADLLHRFFTGKINPLSHKNVVVDPLATHGRFYQVLDYLFAGTTTDPDGFTLLGKSYDYDKGVNLRGKLRVGIADAFGGPTPTVGYHDRRPLIQLGLFGARAGNRVMVSRHDYVHEGQRDYDIDEYLIGYNAPRALYSEMTKNAPSVLGYDKAIDVKEHQHASQMKMFDYTDVNSWIDFQSKQLAMSGERGGAIGKITRISQAVHHFTTTQEYFGPFVSGQTGERYFVGPRFRSMQEMVQAGKHTLAPTYHQIALDSEGKEPSDFMLQEKWRDTIINDMFAVYKAKSDGTVDYASVRNLTGQDTVPRSVIDVVLRSQNELADNLSPGRKHGMSVFTGNLVQNKYDRTSINRTLFNKFWDNKEAKRDLLLGLGVDKDVVDKFTGYKKLAEGETWNSLKSLVYNVIEDREKKPGYGDLRIRNNPEQTTRERLVDNLLERIQSHPIGELPDFTGMHDNIRSWTDAVVKSMGLPDTNTLRELEQDMYGKTPMRVEKIKESLGMIDYKLAYLRDLSSEPHSKRIFEISRLEGLRSKLWSKQQKLIESGEGQYRKMDPEKRIFHATSGPKTKHTSQQVLERFVNTASIEGMLRVMSVGMPEETLIAMNEMSERVEAAMAGNWRGAMGHDPKMPTRRGPLQFDLDAMPAEGTLMVQDTVASANKNIVKQAIEQFEAQYPGYGQMLALRIYSGKANKMHGWALIGRGDPAVTKTAMPIYRNPRSEVLPFLSPKTIATMSQYTNAIMEGMIKRRDSGDWLHAFMDGQENWAGLLGKGEGYPLVWGKSLISGHISGAVTRSLTGGEYDGFKWQNTDLMPVKLGTGRVTVLPISRVMDYLREEKGYVNDAIQLFIRLARNSDNPMLDLTGLPKNHPLADVAAFVLKESKQVFERETYEDIRLSSQWIRNRRDFPIQGVSRASMGISPGPTTAGGPNPGGPFLTGGPTDEAESRVLWEILSGKKPDKRQEEAYAEIGRLKKAALDNPDLRAIYGENFGRDLDVFVTNVLQKDITTEAHRLFLDPRKDVRDLKKAFVLLERKAKRFAALGGSTAIIREWLFNPSALLDTNLATKELAERAPHTDFERANRQELFTRESLTRVVAISELFKLEETLEGEVYKPAVKKLSRIEQRVARYSEMLSRAYLKGEPTDEIRLELDIQKAKLQAARESIPGFDEFNKRIFTLVELIKERTTAGGIVWKEEVEAKRLLSTFKNPDKVLGFVDSVNTYFDTLWPIVKEGWQDYKDLVLMRAGKDARSVDVLKSIEEHAKLEKREGYMPHWDPEFMVRLSVMLDSQDISRSILHYALPMAADPAKHRTQPDYVDTYSKNVVGVMMRYGQEAVTFAYKNRMELLFQRALVKVGTLKEGSVDQLAAYERLESYVDLLRKDTLFKKNDTFLDKMSQTVRGLQLISKLGLRLSAPMRNVGQVFSGFAVAGVRTTLDAIAWMKTEEGRAYIGEGAFKGAGPGELADLSIQRELKAERAGAWSTADMLLEKGVQKSLFFMQKLPFVGEHAGRNLLRNVVLYQMHQHFEKDNYWKMVFANRQFTPELVKAYPELGKMQGGVDKEWTRDWQGYYNQFTRMLAEREAYSRVADVHFSYGRGARMKLLRNPIGAVVFQLQHWTAKNIEFWHKLWDNARAAKQVDEGWGEFMKSQEASSLMLVGLFAGLMSAIGTAIPFGLATRYRPDWMQIWGNTGSGFKALSDGDEEALNKMFFGHGVFHQLTGPAVSDLTTLINIAFASYIGDPENSKKFWLGLRDMRHLDGGKMAHKFGRILGPAALADAIHYDMPRMLETGGKSIPESIASQLGFRYRKDEGQALKMLAEQLGYRQPQKTPYKSQFPGMM